MALATEAGSQRQHQSHGGLASPPAPDAKTLREELLRVGHLASHAMLRAFSLALRLNRPLLLDGPSGTGKTHFAESFARAKRLPLIRLSGHADLQKEDAAYDWNYSRQLLSLRLIGQQEKKRSQSIIPALYCESNLVAKPLLRAIRESEPGRPAVLLIEGLEQSRASLDAVLQPFLDDYRIDIEGLGSLRAQQAPMIFLTTQDARRMSDAIRRPCVYQYCAYPNASDELQILRLAVPDAGERLSQSVIDFVRGLRISDLAQRPGMDQVLAWTKTLRQLDALSLDPEVIHNTLGLLLKHQHELKPLSSTQASTWLAELQQQAQAASVIKLSS